MLSQKQWCQVRTCHPAEVGASQRQSRTRLSGFTELTPAITTTGGYLVSALQKLGVHTTDCATSRVATRLSKDRVLSLHVPRASRGGAPSTHIAACMWPDTAAKTHANSGSHGLHRMMTRMMVRQRHREWSV